MAEISTVRENLMNEKGYSPFCGAVRCLFSMPRSKWDADKNQFTCRCGWVSEFPQDFIKRYKKKWNL